MDENQVSFWETVHVLSRAVASQLEGAGALIWLIPLLTLLGPSILIYLGLQGIRKQRTIVSHRFDQRIVVDEVTGSTAVVVGLTQLALAVLLFAILAPLSAALVGWW